MAKSPAKPQKQKPVKSSPKKAKAPAPAKPPGKAARKTG